MGKTVISPMRCVMGPVPTARKDGHHKGERPVCPVKLGYEWGYLYVALCPFDGDVFAMFYNGLNKACFDHFLSALDSHIAKGKQKGKTLLVGDGATAHTSQGLAGTITLPVAQAADSLPRESIQSNDFLRKSGNIRQKCSAHSKK